MGAVIKINGLKYDFFSDLAITLNHANIASTFSFSALFDPDVPALVELFKPFSYKECVIETDSGQRILTGVILSHRFNTDKTPRLTTFSGYAKTGVLADCPIPETKYPLERTNLSLTEIATDLCEAFGINVVTSVDAKAAAETFSKVVAEPTETVSKFLNGLAAQKNLVINHDNQSNLFIELISTFSNPIAFFDDGEPDVQIGLDSDGQALHSKITVMKQASIGTDNAAQQTAVNPFASAAFRPMVKVQTSGTDNNTEDAAKNSVLSEMRNALKINISTDRWTWVNDEPELIIPNRIIKVLSPSSYIFKPTKFFVDSVTLRSDEKSETAELTCVVPEIFQGGALKNIF